MAIRALTMRFTVASIAAAASFPALAVDSVSFETGYGDHTRMVRVAIQSTWDKQWWKSNGTHVGGHWDLSLAHWRGSRAGDNRGHSQDIAVLGLTPVFRLQNNSLRGFYVEAGIGAYLLSDLYDNDGKRFSTAFQFGDHVGLGYFFSNDLEIGLRIQHFSNASIKKPNPGVNFAIVQLRYAF